MFAPSERANFLTFSLIPKISAFNLLFSPFYGNSKSCKKICEICQVMCCQTLRMITSAGYRTRDTRTQCVMGQVAEFFSKPPTLTACNFAALWPTGTRNKYIFGKVYYPLLISFCSRTWQHYQAIFVVSKCTHFYRAYKLRVCNNLGSAVCISLQCSQLLF